MISHTAHALWVESRSFTSLQIWYLVHCAFRHGLDFGAQHQTVIWFNGIIDKELVTCRVGCGQTE